MSTITTTEPVTTEPVTTEDGDDYTVNTFPGPPGYDLPVLDLADLPPIDTWFVDWSKCLELEQFGLVTVNENDGVVLKGTTSDGEECYVFSPALSATGGEPSVTQAPRNDLPSTGPETAGVLAGVGLALVVIGVAARRTATRRPATPTSGR